MRQTSSSLSFAALVAAITVFSALAVPRSGPALLVLMGGIAVLVMLKQRSAEFVAGLQRPVWYAVAAIIVYLFLNCIWALDQAAAFGKTAGVLVMSAATFSIALFTEKSSHADLGRVQQLSIVAFFAGLSVVMVELAFGMPLSKLALNHIPGMAAALAKHVTIQDGEVVSIEVYLLNRNVTVAVILFWPVFLLAYALRPNWRYLAAGAAAALVAIIAFTSYSATAAAAALAGLLVFGVGILSRRLAKWAVIAAWIAAVAFAVPLGALPAKLGWTNWTDFAGGSAAARFYIWQYTAEKVKERPLTGIGVRGTRILQKGITVPEGPRAEVALRPRPGRHAHNGFLQIWLELGALGAALFLAMGLAVLREIGRFPNHVSVVGYAHFASVCTVAAFGFGLWQGWLLSVVLLSAAGYLVGARLSTPSE